MLPVQKMRYGARKRHPLARRRAKSANDTSMRSTARPKPEWDSSCSDLTKYKLSSEEVLQRKLSVISPHNPLAKSELRRKLGLNGADLEAVAVSQCVDGTFTAVVVKLQTPSHAYQFPVVSLDRPLPLRRLPTAVPPPVHINAHVNAHNMDKGNMDAWAPRDMNMSRISAVSPVPEELERSTFSASLPAAVKGLSTPILRKSFIQTVNSMVLSRATKAEMQQSSVEGEEERPYNPAEYSMQDELQAESALSAAASPSKKHSILNIPYVPRSIRRQGVAYPVWSPPESACASVTPTEEDVDIEPADIRQPTTPTVRVTREVKIPSRIADVLLGNTPVQKEGHRSADGAGLDVSEITKVQSFATGITQAFGTDDTSAAAVATTRYSALLSTKSTSVAFGRGVSSPAAKPAAPQWLDRLEEPRPETTEEVPVSQQQMLHPGTPFSTVMTLSFSELEARIDKLAAKLEGYPSPSPSHEHVVTDCSLSEGQQQDEPDWRNTAPQLQNSLPPSNALDRVRKYLDEFRRARDVAGPAATSQPVCADEEPLPSSSFLEEPKENDTIYAYVPTYQPVFSSAMDLTPLQPRIQQAFVTPPPSPPRDSVGRILSTQTKETVDNRSSRLKWFGVKETPIKRLEATSSASPQIAKKLEARFWDASSVPLNEPTPLPRGWSSTIKPLTS